MSGMKLFLLTLKNNGVSFKLFGIFISAPNDINFFKAIILFDNIDKYAGV